MKRHRIAAWVLAVVVALAQGVGAQEGGERKVRAEPPEYKDIPPEVVKIVSRSVLDQEFLPPPELEGAREIWESVRKDTSNVELLYRLANAYYDEGRPGPARNAFESAVRKDPSHIPSRVNLGVVLNEMGETDAAIYHLQIAVKQKPDDVLALCNLGLAYYAKNERALAVDQYVKALSIDPESQLAHYNLGVAFADAGIYKEAIREWEAVVKAGPGTDAARQAGDNIKVLRNLIRQGE